MTQTSPGPLGRVTVWGENLHEKRDKWVQELYPDGMHSTIASGISERLGERAVVGVDTLDQPEHGTTEEVLQATDVLTWWGRMGHGQVADEVVEGANNASCKAWASSSCTRAAGRRSSVRRWGRAVTCGGVPFGDASSVDVNAAHPITRGVPPVFAIEAEEICGELFDSHHDEVRDRGTVQLLRPYMTVRHPPA